MDASDIIGLARTLTHTDSYQIPDATALTFLNIVYKDLTGMIAREVNEDYFFHTWYIDLLANTNTYGLPAGDDPYVGMLANISISVQYHASGQYVRLRSMSPSSVEADLDLYRRIQPETDPFYVLTDSYVMLYPEPRESVIAGLKIYGVRESSDLTLTSTASALDIPSDYQHIIALGMRRYILSSRGQEEEALIAQKSYEDEKRRMVIQLTEHDLGSTQSVMPSTYHLS